MQVGGINFTERRLSMFANAGQHTGARSRQEQIDEERERKTRACFASGRNCIRSGALCSQMHLQDMAARIGQEKRCFHASCATVADALVNSTVANRRFFSAAGLISWQSEYYVEIAFVALMGCVEKPFFNYISTWIHTIELRATAMVMAFLYELK